MAKPAAMRAGRKASAPARTRDTDKLVVATRAHRKTMDRVLDRQVILPVKGVYNEASDSLSRALRRQFTGKLKQPAGERANYQQLAGIVEAKMRDVSTRLVSEMEQSTRGTLAESAQALATFVHRVQGGSSVLDDEVVMARVMSAQRKALEAARSESIVRLTGGIYGALRARVDKEVAGEATMGQAISAIGEELDQQWWRVERLVRTEVSGAFNRAHAAGIEALHGADSAMRMRWTEHVDDLTHTPMDARVGKDSLVLHGQVALPGKMFHMPNDSRTPKGMAGKSWASPPNRPNDRAVLLPWKAGWGIPAWEWRNGKRVVLRG